jgi:diguanylate cyclase (GGDEF)-like protein
VSPPPSISAPAGAETIQPDDRTRAPTLPRQLSDAEFDLFRAAGQARAVDTDETIFRKGELGRSMFVIETGEIQLEFGDGLPHKLIGPREFFGELALFIGNHARVASAVAAAPSHLRVIEHAAFEQVLEKEPSLLARFMRRSFAYLVASEQQLIANLKRRNEDLIVTLHSLRDTQTQLSVANHLVRTDELTGLTNRRGMYQFLDSLSVQRAPNTQLGLLLIDLDRFKQINDVFGHLAGDAVLCAVAQEVSDNAAASDLTCRIGGDEFALLAQVASREELQMRAASIVAAVRSLRFSPPNDALRISVSIGASLCPDAAQWSVWYSDGDRALYHAKGEGGDGWRISG